MGGTAVVLRVLVLRSMVYGVAGVVLALTQVWASLMPFLLRVLVFATVFSFAAACGYLGAAPLPLPGSVREMPSDVEGEYETAGRTITLLRGGEAICKGFSEDVRYPLPEKGWVWEMSKKTKGAVLIRRSYPYYIQWCIPLTDLRKVK